jgi:hypothetical protein
MTQQEINELLAAALDDAQARLCAQEECMSMLVDHIERLSYRIDGAVAEAQNARLHYADQRKRLGVAVDLSAGNIMDAGFGIAPVPRVKPELGD